jgi:hypothetical protein
VRSGCYGDVGYGEVKSSGVARCKVWFIMGMYGSVTC